MVKFMDNYKILFLLRTLKGILSIFIDSFFVLYFLQISDSNIVPLGIYQLVYVSLVFIVVFLLRNRCKSKNRINLLRIGISLNLIYFLFIILLRENLVNYMYFIGIIYGLEEGFYYSVYNTIESDGVKNSERAKFTGIYTSVKSILSIIFPIIFGSMIYTTGFSNSTLYVLIIVVIMILLSFGFKDINIPKENKTDLKGFSNIIEKDDRLKSIFKVKIFDGLTYSAGALSYIVTIYIAKIFSNSFSLGIFTSIFGVITLLLGVLFAKIINKKHYEKIITVSMTFTILSLVIMVYNCNMITVVIYNLFQTFSKTLTSLINENSQSNISNIEEIKKEYKVEYWLFCEFGLVIGRVISNLLFILIAFVDIRFMIFIFVGFLVMFAIYSINLQRTLSKYKV